MENSLLLYLAISASCILTNHFSYIVTVLDLVLVIIMLIKATYMHDSQDKKHCVYCLGNGRI